MIPFFSDADMALDNNPGNVLMSYNPNDFYYLSVEKDGKGDMPSISVCNHLNPYDTHWDISCNNSNFSQNSRECIDRALCMNRDQSVKISQLHNKNRGVDTKYTDDYKVYYNTLFNSANLGIGIVLMIGFIYTTAFPIVPK